MVGVAHPTRVLGKPAIYPLRAALASGPGSFIIRVWIVTRLAALFCPPIAGVAQLVEHDVANVVVVGSSPITRFLKLLAISF